MGGAQLENNSVPKTNMLSDYMRNNPDSTIDSSEDHYIVKTPWGDDSIEFIVQFSSSELIDAFNSVRLPPRFTAMKHLDSNDVEFIYGEIEEDNPLRTRSFVFLYKKNSYTCEFTDSSKRLILIADSCRSVGPSNSNYRNLLSTRLYRQSKKLIKEDPRLSKLRLTSFWIRNAGLSEDDLLDLARHLNFYMQYFDNRTPVIIINEEPQERSRVVVPERYPHGQFPKTIAGKPFDPYMLSLWETAFSSGNPIQKYLYHYQVLEYAAFYYLKEDVIKSVKRILLSPGVLDSIEDAAKQMMDILAQYRTDDESKISLVINQFVDPAQIWPTVEANKDFFSRENIFEGGFTLQPLIKNEWSLDDFKTAWYPKLPDSLKKLRNCLVHSREQRSSCSVIPSKRNFSILRPWAYLMEAISGQIIVYDSE